MSEHAVIVTVLRSDAGEWAIGLQLDVDEPAAVLTLHQALDVATSIAHCVDLARVNALAEQAAKN